VELLAPAGGPDALRAAVAAGADAAYLGVEALNARRGAENFTLTGLADVCRFAHLRGVRIYLTANVMLLPDELREALELVDAAWAAGVDAVIVQDLGLLGMLRRELPHVRVHSSTQVNAHNRATIEVLRDAGASRVTLAREVSIEEISSFAERIRGVEIESFVHGALCMCYSGQCLLSSLIGGRSANRGTCAQPCRLPYELVNDRGPLKDAPGAYLLSPKDLAGIDMLPQLAASGVSALKIEGRMKSAEYVAVVVGVYRKALDRALADADSYAVRDGEHGALAEAFSRGFSAAYLAGERGNDMMSYQRPNNRGVLIGRVSESEAGFATVAFEAPVESGDTVEFWTGAGRFAQPLGGLAYGGSTRSAAPAGTKARIAVERQVRPGDRVFRVRSASLDAAARRTFASLEGDEVPLDFHVRVVVGEPLRVEVADALGRAGSASGSVVEAARTRAVSADDVAEHVGRLGGTPYTIGAWRLDLSPDAGVGFSALHNARREAIAAYESVLLEPWAERHSALAPDAAADRVPAPTHARTRARSRVREVALVAAAESPEVAAACLNAGADRVHVPTYALSAKTLTDARMVPLSPRVCHDREFASSLRLARTGSGFVAGTLGALARASAAGAEVETHWSLNAANSEAIAFLAGNGARFVWLSPELTAEQISRVVSESVVPVGIAVAGRQEVMVTEHCILMSEGECDRACGRCRRRTAVRRLRDRKGYEFPVLTDVTGRSHLFNAVSLDLTGSIGEVIASGVSAVRVDVGDLDAKAASALVSRVKRALDSALVGVPMGEKEPGTTTGHFYRGVS
jgi:putative protease